MSLRENLARVMKEQGLSAYQLGKESGVAPNHIGAILNGKIKAPRADVIGKLADRLNVSADELLGRHGYEEGETTPTSVVRDHDPPRPEHVVPVPVVGVAVGGSPQDAAEVVGEEYSLLHHLYKPGRFVIRLFGDSMHPTYWSNDLLLVDPKEKVKDGDVALVRVDNESTVKRVFRMKKGRVQLQSDNRTFPAVVVDPDQEFKIEGKILRIVEGERP